MKKFLMIATVALMMILSTSNSYACMSWFGHRGDHNEYNNHGDGDGAVGAPLDGGILAILAAAGGAYFVARKKKKGEK